VKAPWRRFDGAASASYVFGMRNSPLTTAIAAAVVLAGMLAAASAQDALPPLDGAPEGLQQLKPLPRDDAAPAPTPDDSLADQDDDEAEADVVPGRGAKVAPGSGAPPDRDAMLAELYAHLAKASSVEEATPIAKTIETLWLRSGSDTIGLLMRRALKAQAEQNSELAMQMLDAVVELAPDYAEGWSRRAVLYYSQDDVEHAVGDLRRALALDPNHYKALQGLAAILNESGQKKSALGAYRQLLRIYPQLPGAKQIADELRIEVEGRGI
jgi:tetratricopeptide (TPR) repeat protein